MNMAYETTCNAVQQTLHLERLTEFENKTSNCLLSVTTKCHPQNFNQYITNALLAMKYLKYHRAQHKSIFE